MFMEIKQNLCLIIVVDVMFIETTNYNIRIENYDNEEY